MNQERHDQLRLMQQEFEDENTTDDRRVEILTLMRSFAEQEMPDATCIYCKQVGIYAPYTHALIEGHCYTQDGVRDFTRITGVCEFCFDKAHEGVEE